MIKEETAQREQSERSQEPDWIAELSRAKEQARAALQQLEEWHQRLRKLTNQLEAVRAEQQAALADHSAESRERVERIATAQIRERVIAADLEHESVPRNQLVNALRDAAKRLGQPVVLAYLRERERRVAATLAELRATLDPGIVAGLESIEEPGHTMSDHMRQWPTMLQFAAGLHSRVRKLASVAVTTPNFDSFSREVTDEELGYFIGSASGFLAAIAKLQAEIDGHNPT